MTTVAKNQLVDFDGNFMKFSEKCNRWQNCPTAYGD
jgi:hypothetical protein